MEPELVPEGDLKPCPYCAELIMAGARKCRFCKEYLDPELRAAEAVPEGFDRILTWEGTPASAIAAGYLGLFSLLPFFGLFAILFGIIALRKLKQNPRLPGKFRAWFGLIFGGLMTLLYLAAIIMALIGAADAAAGRRPRF